MGRYFESFSVGEILETPRRTVTETDIVQFAGLSGDFNPLHTDDVFAAGTQFGQRVAHGPMLIGMAFGLLSRLDVIDGTALALKGIEWSFDAPVVAGDTVRVRAEVLEARPSRRYSDRGTVRFGFKVINQNNTVVQIGQATVILMRATDRQ